MESLWRSYVEYCLKRGTKIATKMDTKIPENPKETKATEQRSASLVEQDARQRHLAMEANVAAVKKTRERTEGAAAVVQAKHEDSCAAKRVQAGPTSLTSFSMKAETPAPPRRDDVLVDIDAAAPKPCLSPVEMRALIATGGLLPTGKTSTVTMTIFHQLALLFYLIKEIKSRTSQ